MNEFDKITSKKNESREKKKKTILIGIGICIFIIVFLAIMIVHYQNVDAKTFKLFINDGQVEFGDGFYFTNEDGETYVRARDIANYIQWTYQNGEYGSFTEDTNSGYIQNEYEVASFVAGSNIIKKYIQVTAAPYKDEFGNDIQPYQVNSENGTLETTTLDIPIISKDGQIYFPLKNLNDICNCNVNYENPYRMYIYEQRFLTNLAQTNAAQFGLQSISGVYENMRLLPYGMMVVSNGKLYGVVNLYDGTDIIGLKYTDMIFVQNVKEFFVKTSSNQEESVGIINMQGVQIVSPKNYSDIQVLSDELGLYLVQKDGEYGVLNRNGEVIIHCEYDSIGIPENLISQFEFSVEDNKYLLFNNVIIVEADGKFGLYDIDGTQTLPTAYIGFGYIVDEDSDAVKNSEDVLTIEINDLQLANGTNRNVQAIIVQQEVDNTTKYGVYDVESKKLILPCIYDRIYSITSRGNTEYYIEFQGQRAKFSDQLAQYPEIFEN